MMKRDVMKRDLVMRDAEKRDIMIRDRFSNHRSRITIHESRFTHLGTPAW